MSCLSFTTKYKPADLLGSGSYADVYEVLDDDELVIKIYDGPDFVLQGFNEEFFLQKLLGSGLSPEYQDSYYCEPTEKFYLVSEKIDIPLLDYILEDYLRLSDIEELERKIQRLHQQYKILHNDIRLDNLAVRILVNGETKYEIVLLDFNLAQTIERYNDEDTYKDFEFVDELKYWFKKGYRRQDLINEL